MQQFFEIVSHWDHLGQGVFFLLVIGGILQTITALFKYIAILFCGWPTEEQSRSVFGDTDSDDVNQQ